MSLPIAWDVAIDWNGNGSFGDANESMEGRLKDIRFRGGRNGATDQFSAASCTMVLENSDGLLSRYNTSSAIYGQMLPGRAVRVQATHNSITYPQFRGEIIEFVESVTPNGVPVVVVTALDGLEKLRRAKIRLALQESARVDQLITALLDAAGWDATMRSLDVALTTVDRYWAHRQGGLEALFDAAKQELGGQLYCRRDGYVTWENRDHRSGEAVYATLSDAAGTAVSLRATDLIDRVEFTRAGLDVDSTTTVLYTLVPTGRQLDPGTSSPLNTINADYAVGGKNVVTPIATTDYVANSQPDGSGTDKTAQVVVNAFTSYGGGFGITFQNLDSSPVYLTQFQVRGQAVRRSNDERLIAVNASSPLVTDQVLSESFDWNDDADAIKAFAAWRAETLSQDQPRPTVRPLVHTDAEIAMALGIDVSKRVTLALTTGLYPAHLSGDYIVEGFELHAIPEENGDMELELRLWSEDQAIADFFRISGSVGAGQDYSQLAAASGDILEYVGIQFDGVNDQVNIPDNAALNTGTYTAKTFEVFFRTASDITSRQVVYEQGGGTRGLNIYLDAGYIYCCIWNVAEHSWGPLWVRKTINIDTFYRISFVFDKASDVVIAYDGGLEFGRTSGINDSLHAHVRDISFASVRDDTRFHDVPITGSGYYFGGSIVEGRAWNVARTAQQIQDALGIELTGSEANLAAYWKFDDNSGPTVTDYGPNAIHGTMVGASWALVASQDRADRIAV